MAGTAFGSLGAAAIGLVGLVSVLRARRKHGDPAADKRLAQRLEMERRMASYLAQGKTEPVPPTMKNQGASDERG